MTGWKHLILLFILKWFNYTHLLIILSLFFTLHNLAFVIFNGWIDDTSHDNQTLENNYWKHQITVERWIQVTIPSNRIAWTCKKWHIKNFQISKWKKFRSSIEQNNIFILRKLRQKYPNLVKLLQCKKKNTYIL